MKKLPFPPTGNFNVPEEFNSAEYDHYRNCAKSLLNGKEHIFMWRLIPLDQRNKDAKLSITLAYAMHSVIAKANTEKAAYCIYSWFQICSQEKYKQALEIFNEACAAAEHLENISISFEIPDGEEKDTRYPESFKALSSRLQEKYRTVLSPSYTKRLVSLALEIQGKVSYND